MFEAIQYYQSLAQRFQSQLLTGPGILIVLIGLSIWLAGLRWKKVLGALAGGATVLMAMLTFTKHTGSVLALASAAAAVIGAVIEKVILGIFAAAFAAVVVLIIASSNAPAENVTPAVEFYDTDEYDPENITADDFISGYSYPMFPDYEDPQTIIPAPAAVEITLKMAGHFIDKAQANIATCGTASYACAGFAAVCMVIIAMALPRLFIATISAVLGSAVVFLGMIMLLLE